MLALHVALTGVTPKQKKCRGGNPWWSWDEWAESASAPVLKPELTMCECTWSTPDPRPFCHHSVVGQYASVS